MTRSIFFAIAILICTSTAVVAASKIEVKHIASYSGKSMGGVLPSKLYIDFQEGELYVASQSKEIVIINEDGMVVHRISLSIAPQVFCVTKNGDIYLTNDRGGIDVLNYRGEFKGNLDISTVPDYTSLTIQSLYIDENGLIYIGDAKMSRVIVLDSDGRFLFQFGKKGSGEGEFLNAKSITTDADRLYLLDPPLFRVSVFNKSDGKFLFMFGFISSLLGGFSMPTSIDTDGERLFVVDTNRTVVIIFDREGKPIVEFGGVGRGPENLSWPSDIKVDKNGKIYVCDTGNSRVQIYELIIEDTRQ
jgi:DNA-binding beta-propeller fold protein YncE